jgi:hypothetical protein
VAWAIHRGRFRQFASRVLPPESPEAVDTEPNQRCAGVGTWVSGGIYAGPVQPNASHCLLCQVPSVMSVP